MISDNTAFNVPILFLIFNRPYETRIAFEAIRYVKPSKLFVACDGPREGHPTDSEHVEQVKSIVMNIDWACEIEYLFQKDNLGCGKGVSTAIDWFFSKVEAGVILEDDCIATPSFFAFCEEMLIRYASNPKIMTIAGTNITKGISYTTDYVFTNFPIMWGWATWKRAWRMYDLSMSQWPQARLKKSFAEAVYDKWKLHPVYIEFFDRTYDSAQSLRPHTWDHQWIFCNWINNGLTVTTSKNLVRNIGFGADATHTVTDSLGRGNFNTFTSLPPYKGPKDIEADHETDRYISKYWFTATWLYYSKILLLRVSLIKKLWLAIKSIK